MIHGQGGDEWAASFAMCFLSTQQVSGAGGRGGCIPPPGYM